jgi:DNA mismatch endonuclease (patch repair protein)
MPRANATFWASKFEANLQRDRAANEELRRLGWDVVTIWEHEIRPDVRPRAQVLADEVRCRRGRRLL